MKSNWIPVNPSNNISWANAGTLKKIIDEQIEWYDRNSTRAEDDYIKAHLKLIKNLAENIESSDEIMFLEKIFKTMCEIIEVQRGVISDLEFLESQQITVSVPNQSYVSLHTVPEEGFSNDEQIKAFFTAYMQKEGKSPFTTNDYILRIQNLWRSFFEEYEKGNLPSELAESVIREELHTNFPLLNAYNYIVELNCYLSMKIAGNSSNRNWLNVRAALNIFGEAMRGKAYEKVKVARDSAHSKDFSKYLFEGNTYGKSRLVLAVVKKYVEDHHPATFDELESVFPSSLQGSLGVVRRIDEVSDKYKGIGGVKRYFVDDVINLVSGEKVVVCTQWGANIERFIDHVKNKLKYRVEKV